MFAHDGGFPSKKLLAHDGGYFQKENCLHTMVAFSKKKCLHIMVAFSKKKFAYDGAFFLALHMMVASRKNCKEKKSKQLCVK